MPKTLTITEAQAHSWQVLTDACNGEDIIITDNNIPILHLQPIAQANVAKTATSLREQREKALESIKERRKNRQKPAATIEEIIAWRNEERK